MDNIINRDIFGNKPITIQKITIDNENLKEIKTYPIGTNFKNLNSIINNLNSYIEFKLGDVKREPSDVWGFEYKNIKYLLKSIVYKTENSIVVYTEKKDLKTGEKLPDAKLTINIKKNNIINEYINNIKKIVKKIKTA